MEILILTLDTNYVRESHRKEYSIRNRRSTYIKELAEEDFNEEMLQSEETNNYPIEKVANMKLTELCMPLENISLEDQLANIGASFHDKLFELIDKAHLDNKDVWKRANLDRKHFSKIQCDHNYHPKKKNSNGTLYLHCNLIWNSQGTCLPEQTGHSAQAARLI